ncbi:ABC transporter substrate-binding protein [Leucothrix mucor]|uniref:ABC transporter substrate-binding protein n=1 Tax=Leucothrix mucor TaxID=45248 RepID=UPI0003B438A5|nr:ABC transporter substrate-binding protein [Leucothrix mucor]
MKWLTTVVLFVCLLNPLLAEEPRSVDVLYLKIQQAERPTLSNLDPIPDDLGLKGAELGMKDNNTTGSFLGYTFQLDIQEFDEADSEEGLASVKAAIKNSDADYVLLDMNAKQQLAVIDEAGSEQKLFFNVRAYDVSLRNEACRANLLHTLPSYAMRADAFMQFLIQKKWNTLHLLEGNSEEDALFAQALRRSAKKYQLEFQQDSKWLLDGDLRRHAASEVSLLTQKFGDYDVLFVADEWNDFARYIRYNTWKPRPIFGGDGLRSMGWSEVFEQWGSAQLQSRFKSLADRAMQSEDYAAWIALRAIDEVNLKTKFAPLSEQRTYLLNDAELAGFKGRPLSFRDWNGQLRQPIGLAHQSALVAMAPLDGFLHSRNELDGLGYDKGESDCNAFKE